MCKHIGIPLSGITSNGVKNVLHRKATIAENIYLLYDYPKQMIYPNVKIGKNCRIEPFCIIGLPFGEESGKKTIIGDNSIIRSHTVIHKGVKTGKGFQTGHFVQIDPDNTFGDNVKIGSGSVILAGCRLADNVSVHCHVELAEHIRIGEDTWIGPGVKSANMIHPKRYNCPDKTACEKKGAPRIGKRVRIGANATIGCFVKIGDDALVASGANVVKSVSKGTVVAGNPAKVIKKTDEIVCKFDEKILPYRR